MMYLWSSVSWLCSEDSSGPAWRMELPSFTCGKDTACSRQQNSSSATLPKHTHTITVPSSVPSVLAVRGQTGVTLSSNQSLEFLQEILNRLHLLLCAAVPPLASVLAELITESWLQLRVWHPHVTAVQVGTCVCVSHRDRVALCVTGSNKVLLRLRDRQWDKLRGRLDNRQKYRGLGLSLGSMTGGGQSFAWCRTCIMRLWMLVKPFSWGMQLHPGVCSWSRWPMGGSWSYRSTLAWLTTFDLDWRQKLI